MMSMLHVSLFKHLLASVRFDGDIQTPDGTVAVSGQGNGPIDAFFSALGTLGIGGFTFVDYAEHAVSDGSDSQAVAYIHLRDRSGEDLFGVGLSHNINVAPLRGILSAINRSVGGYAQ